MGRCCCYSEWTVELAFKRLRENEDSAATAVLTTTDHPLGGGDRTAQHVAEGGLLGKAVL